LTEPKKFGSGYILDHYFSVIRKYRNFPRRVAKREMSMFKEIHPRDFLCEYRIIGMYANIKPFPKPPSFLSASRLLSFHRQKKPFQVAYDGPSFYTQRLLDRWSLGKIATRLLSYFLTASPVSNV